MEWKKKPAGVVNLATSPRHRRSTTSHWDFLLSEKGKIASATFLSHGIFTPFHPMCVHGIHRTTKFLVRNMLWIYAGLTSGSDTVARMSVLPVCADARKMR